MRSTRYVFAICTVIGAMFATPALTRADPEHNKDIVAYCKDVASSAGASPSCTGQCISLFQTCVKEDGTLIDTAKCFAKLEKAENACFP